MAKLNSLSGTPSRRPASICSAMASKKLPREGVPPFCRHLALVIRGRRERAGLSQAELADLAGLSRMTVQFLESGHTVPKTDTVDFIARALRISHTELTAEAERHAREEVPMLNPFA